MAFSTRTLDRMICQREITDGWKAEVQLAMSDKNPAQDVPPPGDSDSQAKGSGEFGQIDAADGSEVADNAGRGRGKVKWVLGLAILCVSIFGYWWLRDVATLDNLANWETKLRQGYSDAPMVYLFSAFLLYVLITGLSIPSSTVLSIAYAWLLGWVAIPLLSLAATTGATVAFLTSRYVLHDWVQRRFKRYIQPINRGFERDGAFYVVSLRMIAAFPFFVLNLVLGLVPIRTTTFFLATLTGMLPLTVLFVYLGSQLPSLETIRDGGISSLISWQILLAFGLVGTIPILLRRVVPRFFNSRKTSPKD